MCMSFCICVWLSLCVCACMNNSLWDSNKLMEMVKLIASNMSVVRLVTISTAHMYIFS